MSASLRAAAEPFSSAHAPPEPPGLTGADGLPSGGAALSAAPSHMVAPRLDPGQQQPAPFAAADSQLPLAQGASAHQPSACALHPPAAQPGACGFFADAQPVPGFQGFRAGLEPANRLKDALGGARRRCCVPARLALQRPECCGVRALRRVQHAVWRLAVLRAEQSARRGELLQRGGLPAAILSRPARR